MVKKQARGKGPEDYLNDPAFVAFVDREFNSAWQNASLEELAAFAFGSLQEAIKEFEARNRGGGATG